MKNNEYNIVKVTNEKKNFSGEFTSSQSFEFSFQKENDDSFKDELNSKPVVNDKVEENLSKKAKEQEEKKKEKQDSHEIENLSSSSSSVSSASASSAASSASSAAASGGASAVASVAAAASVSVAAIGAVVGINVLGTKDYTDQINFLSSEVTANSIEFSFSAPSSLLTYYEDPTTGDRPQYEKYVVYQIKNSSGFSDEGYIEWTESENPDYFIFNAYISGLTANTGYSLDIQLVEESVEYEEFNYHLLAHRTFTTLESAPETVTFLTPEVSGQSATIRFLIDFDVADYDPSYPDVPALYLELANPSGKAIEEGWIGQDQVAEYDSHSLIITASYNALSYDTTYKLSVSISRETEYKLLGELSFTSGSAPQSGFRWNTTDVAENTFTFRYYVNADYVGYVEGSETNPTLFADIVYKDTEETAVYDDEPASVFTSGSTLVVYDVISGLTAETDYVINVGYLSGNDREILGTYEFTTTERTTGFRFDEGSIIVTDSTILPRFYLKTTEIVEKSGGEETNIYMTISGGMAYSEVKNVTFTSAMEEGLSYSEDYVFSRLNANITYTVTVTNNLTGEIYGSIELTTNDKSEPIGFEFRSFEKRSSSSNIYDLVYVVNSSFTTDPNGMTVEVITADDGENVFSGQISGSLEDDLLYCYGTIDSGLDDGTAYIAGIYYSNGDLLGVYNFETDPNQYGFQYIKDSIEITHTSIEFSFYLNKSEVQSVAGVTAIIMEEGGAEDLDNISVSFEDDETEGKLVGSVAFANLEPTTRYVVSIMESGGSYTQYASKVFETSARPVSSFTGLNDYSTSYYCTVDLASSYIFIPLKCEYSDPEGIYTNGFSIVFVPTSNPSLQFVGTADLTPDYQECKIDDAEMIGELGSTFNIDVYNANDLNNSLYAATGITITNAEDDLYNYFYAGEVLQTSIYDYGTANLQIELVYVYGNSDVNRGPQIKLANPENGYSEYYIFDISTLSRSVTIDMITSLSESWDNRNFSSFSDVQSALSSKSWDIIVIWDDGGSSQSHSIQTGVTLDFYS